MIGALNGNGKTATPTESEIMKALSRVVDLELHRDIAALGMVRGLRVHDGVVEFTVALTISECPQERREQHRPLLNVNG